MILPLLLILSWALAIDPFLGCLANILSLQVYCARSILNKQVKVHISTAKEVDDPQLYCLLPMLNYWFAVVCVHAHFAGLVLAPTGGREVSTRGFG